MYIAIDIGGTSARVAAFNSTDSDRIDRAERFNMTGKYADDLVRLRAAIAKLTNGEQVGGIGLATAGTLDKKLLTLSSAGNIRDWVGKPIVSDLGKIFGCEVIWLNDAQAAALAEAFYGNHQGKDMWFVIWGTGIGGSIITFPHGRQHVVDAEPTHMVLDASDPGPVHRCGNHGCFELFCGGGGIEERYGKPAERLTEAQWSEVSNHLALGLYNLVLAYPVEQIVLGGGIANKQPRRFPSIEQELNRLLDGFRIVRLDLASHGEDAGLVGALALLK